MKIQTGNKRSAYIRLTWNELYIMKEVIRHFHSHLVYDVDANVWTDDGSLIMTLDEEDKQWLDELVESINK